MIKLLKKILSRLWPKHRPNSEDIRTSEIQKLITNSGLNRRKNYRIKYAHIGAVGDLPRVHFKNDEMNVGNISTGGLMIIDDTESLSSSLGDIMSIELSWTNNHKETKAKIVGVNKQRRHLQFINFDAELYIKINSLISPAFLGSKMHQVHARTIPIDCNELWIGPTGESISIYHDHTKITFKKKTLIMYPGQPVTMGETNALANMSFISESLVLLSNINKPSQKILSLVEELQDYYKNNGAPQSKYA